MLDFLLNAIKGCQVLEFDFNYPYQLIGNGSEVKKITKTIIMRIAVI